MAADFFLGESLVGDGNEVAHIDLIIGSKSGPAGAAFCNALTNNKDGFTTLLAVVAPNLPAKPDTILFNKVTIKGAKQAVQMFGPAQAAVARAVVDSVESGVIPQRQGRRLLHHGRRVHPLGRRATTRRSTTTTTRRPRSRSSARSAGKPSVDEVIAGVEDREAPVPARSKRQHGVTRGCGAGSAAPAILRAASHSAPIPCSKLLLQLDTSPHPSVFDRVVALRRRRRRGHELRRRDRRTRSAISCTARSSRAAPRICTTPPSSSAAPTWPRASGCSPPCARRSSVRCASR